MRRQDLADLLLFATVAEQGSFTRAAVLLGLSGSALSHAMRGLEERLGMSLLHRTTRSVAPTHAGEQLLRRLGPALRDIEVGLEVLAGSRAAPAGRLRISTHRVAALTLIIPKLAALARTHPGIVVELAIEEGLVDIVSAGFDAGVRHGEQLAKDMVAVRIGPDCRTAVVTSPAYLAERARPSTPGALDQYACIGYRHTTSGALHRWAFEKDGRSLQVAVEPAFITNDSDAMIQAALNGVGLAYVLDMQVTQHIASGALVSVLEDWSVPLAGSFLYFPSRRQMSPSMRVLVDTLRYAVSG